MNVWLFIFLLVSENNVNKDSGNEDTASRSNVNAPGLGAGLISTLKSVGIAELGALKRTGKSAKPLLRINWPILLSSV